MTAPTAEPLPRRVPSAYRGRRASFAVAATLLALATPSAFSGAARAQTVNASLRVDPDLPAGTDGNGNLLLYSPNPLQEGSSISHWDPSASPNLLMEPSTSSDLTAFAVDVTRQQMRDIGWRTTGGSRIVIHYQDAAGEGFNDPSLGAQRKQAIQAVADAWGAILDSPVDINVNVRFDALGCGQGGGVLAQAGTRRAFQPPGARFRNTWYHAALADAIAGRNLTENASESASFPDLQATFNSEIDDACLGSGSRFYYGLDSNEPSGTVNFITVAMHEFGHGLGFQDLADASTGQLLEGRPDIYTRFTFDNGLQRHWADMTPAQIIASAVSGNLVWDGPAVRSALPGLLEPSPAVRINSPASIAGSFRVGTAQFGPSVNSAPVTRDLVLVNDGSANPTLGCQPPTNGAQLQGKIALIDRGTCLFVEKVKNVQNTGAVGVIIANNVTGGVITMGGDDNTLVIPTLMVSLEDGRLFKDALQGIDPPKPPPTDPPPVDPPTDPPPVDPPMDPPPPETEDPSICVESDTNLCLNDSRYRIEITWNSGTANGVGQAVALTPDTGFFWFFSEENVEVVIKVRNACNKFDHFWVFAGGLTDIEVEIKVVDTVTGLVRRYNNQSGAPFQPIRDTDFFETCDGMLP